MSAPQMLGPQISGPQSHGCSKIRKSHGEKVDMQLRGIFDYPINLVPHPPPLHVRKSLNVIAIKGRVHKILAAAGTTEKS